MPNVKIISGKPQAFLQDIRDRGGIGVCVHSLNELAEQLQPFLAEGRPITGRGQKTLPVQAG